MFVHASLHLGILNEYPPLKCLNYVTVLEIKLFEWDKVDFAIHCQEDISNRLEYEGEKDGFVSETKEDARF